MSDEIRPRDDREAPPRGGYVHRLFLVVEPAGQDAANSWFETRNFGRDTFTTKLYAPGGGLAYYCADMVCTRGDVARIRTAFDSGQRQQFDRNHLSEAADRGAGEQTRQEILDSLGVGFRPGFG